jgi:hypothetical protein
VSRTRLGLVVGILGIVVGLAGCGASAGASGISPTDGAGLVNALCHRCHPIQRVQVARKSRDAWTATVNRMRSHGLVVTDQQAQSIINYLARRDDGS